MNGLSALVEGTLGYSPPSGALFLFCNRHRNKLKLLYWGVSRMRTQVRNAVPLMGVGLPRSACRSRSQTTECCCVQKAQ
ncbi:MAG: IS66 family insertion sequence element accessory protein TnpB [Acidobacteriaceae bacterium]